MMADPTRQAACRGRYPWIAAWLALAGLGWACDGGEQAGVQMDAGAPLGREPVAPGEPLALCERSADCGAMQSCVLAQAGRGHCYPNGTGGGRCSAAGGGMAACAPGLACDDESLCVPLVGVGDLCLAAVCAPGLACGHLPDAWRCLPPGVRGGQCRNASPTCEPGLGCITGANVCDRLHPEHVCFDGQNSFGCSDGLICPHWPRDLDSATAHCGVPGGPGGPCGDPARGRPRCQSGLGCASGVCLVDAIAPGGACIPAAGHPPCVDGSRCAGNVCVADGQDGTPCRSPRVFLEICDADLACVDGTCRVRVAVGQGCTPSNTGERVCQGNAECIPVGPTRQFTCLADGSQGGRCASPAATCDGGLVCSQIVGGRTACIPGLAVGTICTRAREPFAPCVVGSSCSLVDNQCAPDGQLGTRCGAGGVCPADSACVYDGTANYCFPVPPLVAPGAPCDNHPDRLQRDNRCPPDLECVAGACVSPGANGASCREVGLQSVAAGGRCDAGLACLAGVCGAGRGAGISCAAGGEGDCANPLLCVGLPGNSTCQAVPDFVMTVVPKQPGAVRPDACAGGAVISLRDLGDRLISERDDGWARVALPFSLMFHGQPHSEIHVATNGVAGFPMPGEFLNVGRGGNGLLPAAFAPALIAPFWDDLVLADPGTSEMCQRTSGRVGVRIFTLTWRHLQRFAQPGTSLTFSLVFAESDGSIEMHHDDLFGPEPAAPFVSGVRAAIGLQSAGGVRALVHAGPVSTRSFLRFVPGGLL